MILDIKGLSSMPAFTMHQAEGERGCRCRLEKYMANVACIFLCLCVWSSLGINISLVT